MFERTALPGGPRVISARLPGARSLAVAVYVLAGSRFETRERAGIAHFMEHLTFKGTRAYPTTRAVSEAIEGVGGTSNAATDRESTVYFTRLPLREAERGVEVMAELVARPMLRDQDIERERPVIVDEIRSYRDDPGQYVYNLFDEALYGDTPLGWEICGDEGTVSALDGEQIRDFWRSAYRPTNTVVALAGDIEHRFVVDLVRRAYAVAPGERSSEEGNGAQPHFAPAPPLPNGERVRLLERQTAQAYLCLGLPALRRDDPDIWVLELLNTILGEGASSRLFLEMREEQGLAYDVHSFSTEHADCGALQVFAGVDPDDLGAAVGAILAELSRLREEPVPGDELERARAYARGRLELRLEETRHLCSWIGVQEALHERVLDLDEALGELEGVTSARMCALAQRLLRDDALRLAVIAPPGAAKGLDAALRLP